MKRSFAGTGSSLIVLVFSVLCLTIFSIISLSAASIDKSMAEAELRTVTGYYQADFLAESILAAIIEADTVPDEVMGVEILSEGGYASYSCPISDNKELYVEIELTDAAYQITDWRMRDTAEWENDGGLPVWSGE